MLKSFLRTNLDYLGISRSAFPSRNNLKLYNIPKNPKMVKKTIVDLDSFKVSLKMVDKVITDLHSFKASGAYFTSVVVRKN